MDKHLLLNCISNVKVMRYAVSSVNGKVCFDCDTESSMGHISDKGIYVESYTIDYLVYTLHIHKPDLIKMDIEGAEYEALLGAEKVLKENKPSIFLSTHSEDIKEKCIKYLIDLGYKYRFILNDEILFS